MSGTIEVGNRPARLVSRKLIHGAPIIVALFCMFGLSYSSYAWVSLQAGSKAFYWRNPTVAFAIHEECHPGIHDGSDVTAVRLAFQEWEKVPGSRVAFWEDTSPSARSRTDWRSDDISLVLWDTTNESGFFTPGTGLVAITPVDFDTRTGEILDADILFNGSKPFSTDGDAGSFDIQNIATHEVGHFIGLDHSAVVGATMNPFAYTRDTRLRSLATDDKAAAATIYPVGGEPASLQGFVKLNGTAISGAHVVAEDEQGRPASATLSDGNGFFHIRGLQPGTYAVYAEPLDGPVTNANFSLHTSNLRIDTNFGTTFWGATNGRSHPAEPSRVQVGFAQRVDIGELSLLPQTSINVTSVSPNTLTPGAELELAVGGVDVGRGADTKAVVIPSALGDVQILDARFPSASQARVQVYVAPAARPQLCSIRVFDYQTWACSVYTGGFEVRDPGPIAEGLSIASGAPGTAVSVLGDRFQSGARALVGPVVVSTTVSSTEVRFAVPSSLPDGTYDVTVENPDGQFAKLQDAFTVSGSLATPGGGSGGIGSPPPPPPAGSATAAARPPSRAASGSDGGGGGGGCALSPVPPADGSADPSALLALALLGALLARRGRVQPAR